MLTDTYTAQAFFVDFIADPQRALRWTALRQDSGDPFKFVKEAKEAWMTVGKLAGMSEHDGTLKGRRIVFSDGLDVKKAIDLQKGCDEHGVGGERYGSGGEGDGRGGGAGAVWTVHRADMAFVIAAFGIGTSLTNDFNKASDPSEISKPLNIVIKLNQIDGKPCVKLSDDKGKVRALACPRRTAS
jgi:nicotinate phosphoribosyltransferase